MEDALRTLVLLALAAAGLTAAAAGLAWWFETPRRMRRTLKRVLKGVPEAEAIDPAQGRAAGLDFQAESVAVLWDKGASGLVYSFQELVGAELIVDGHVAARVSRDEPRRPLDAVDANAEQVALRLMFADPRYPEFELDLWGEQSTFSARGATATDAVKAGRKWLAHVDMVVKLPRPKPAAAVPVRELPPEDDFDEDDDEEQEEAKLL
jgi:hypothetical protein